MMKPQKIGALLLSLLLCCNMFTFGILAAEDTAEELTYYSSDLHLTAEDQAFLEKVVSTGEFYYIDNNELKISLAKDELTTLYGYSDSDYSRLMNTVIGTYVPDDDNVIQPNVYIENATLYITNEDLSAGVFAVLVTAAAAGPAAIAAALTALSTMLAGPVGTFIGGLLAALSAPSLLELGVKVTQAVATGRGLYIKPVFSYPPFEFGFWG